MPVTIGGGLSFCGHALTEDELDLVRRITREFANLTVTELAATLCELLDWKRPNGGLKSRECYLFLLSLRSRGWLPWLPKPRPRTRNPHSTTINERSEPQTPLSGSLAEWSPVQLERIDHLAQRQLFEQYIQRYHYLGYRVPYGAQLRYFVWSGSQPCRLLACLLFTSAAWKMAPRDRYVGWSEAARPENLCRVVNNSRFLILPWVRIPHLASHILSRAARQLRLDWRKRYGVEPVLLASLVVRDRSGGTWYRAATWSSVGLTQGRGRMDRTRSAQGSRKEILLYPLVRRWQSELCESSAKRPLTTANAEEEE